MRIITTTKRFFAGHPYALYGLIGVALLLVIVGYVLTFRTQPVVYSYGGQSCHERLTLFPGIMQSTSESYTISPRDSVTVGSVDVMAKRLCIAATELPQEHASQLASISPLGGPLFKTTYKVEAPSYPKVATTFDEPIPLSKPVSIKLTKPDATFSYQLQIGKKRVDCQPDDSTVVCDLTKLGLVQGKQYAIALERSYDDQVVDTPLQDDVTTLSPLKVTSTSIKNEQTVYAKPKELKIETGKLLESAEVVIEQKGDKPTTLDTSTIVTGDTAVTSFADELPRNTAYTVTATAVAKDGSMFVKPLSLQFTTSGGPKVTSTTIGSTGYVPGTPIVIQFDQALHPNLDTTKYVSLKGIQGAVTVQGSKLVVTAGAVAPCAPFSVTVNKGVVSKYDIASDRDWSMSSRARCYRVGTIGNSVNGRPITAYYFGNGGRTIIYTGAIHGNELSSKYIMESWIDELDANMEDVPDDVTLVVVPVVNPDGTAIGARSNTRGVNLNRNFPTRNWVSDIITGTGLEEGEGGSASGSEPETKALMSLTQRLNPALVVTFHSQGSLVNSNDAGDSIAKAQRYASLAGYRFISNAATTGTFGFEMTGTYEDWLLERGTPAFLIELNTNQGNHFVQNRAALWSTMR